jgi:hypothetical protein
MKNKVKIRVSAPHTIYNRSEKAMKKFGIPFKETFGRRLLGYKEFRTYAEAMAYLHGVAITHATNQLEYNEFNGELQTYSKLSIGIVTAEIEEA